MTQDTKLTVLRTMIDNYDESDETLFAFLDLAKDKVLNRLYPFKTDYTGLTVPDRYASVQLKVAAYMLQKRGAEGQIQHIENGIHRNYGSADIPDGMLQEIVPYCQPIG